MSGEKKGTRVDELFCAAHIKEKGVDFFFKAIIHHSSPLCSPWSLFLSRASLHVAFFFTSSRPDWGACDELLAHFPPTHFGEIQTLSLPPFEYNCPGNTTA